MEKTGGRDSPASISVYLLDVRFGLICPAFYSLARLLAMGNKDEGGRKSRQGHFILHPSSFGRGAHLQRKLHQTRGGGAFSGIGWRGGVRPDVRNECAASFQGDSTNSEVSGCSPPRR